MVTTFQEVPLDSRAVTFLHQRLTEGKTLAAMLLEQNILSGGTASAFVPEGASNRSLYSFSGGLAPESWWQLYDKAEAERQHPPRIEPFPSVTPHLVGRINDFLQSDVSHLCLFEEDFFDISEESVVNDPRLRVLSYGNELYYLVTHSDRDPELIDVTIRSTPGSWPGILCVFTSGDDAKKWILPGARISLDSIRRFAERTKRIVVGAYDGEGYVVWTPRG